MSKEIGFWKGMLVAFVFYLGNSMYWHHMQDGLVVAALVAGVPGWILFAELLWSYREDQS